LIGNMFEIIGIPNPIKTPIHIELEVRK